MAMRDDIKQREADKFVQSPTRPDGAAIEIVGITSPSSFSPPANADYILRTVFGNVETYTYKEGGAGGTLLATVTVTYTASNLKDLVSVEVA